MTTGLRTISPSQMRFWDLCPQAWHYTYNEELYRDKIQRTYFDFGNYTHELMHVYYKILQANPTLQPGSDFVISAMQARVRNDLSVANIENSGKVWKRVLSYLTNQSPEIDSNITIIGVEEEFKIPFTTPRGHEVALHGFIDLRYIDRAGNVRIRDHKTGANPTAHSARTVQLDDQLLFYGVANNVLDVEINFISSKILEKKEVPLPEQFNLYRYQHTPVGLAIAQANILQKVDLMLDSPTWKNYSPRCPNCAFFDICHLESRGINSTRVKLTSYKKGRDNDRPRPKQPDAITPGNKDTEGDSTFKISFT